MAAQGPEAYATLLVSDSYLPGALVLAHSLRDNGTKKLLVALVTLDSVSGATIAELNIVYDQIIPVDRIINKSPANLYLMDRPDLASTFTKIALWRQTQFSRLVYMDADVVALRAADELFSRPSTFAAAPDVGWPDCFNSGVMALTPNMGDYYALLALAQRGISFDGADQGLLNMHFGNYDRISFTYNCTPSGHYQYVPAYRHFQSAISMVHFIGKDKPWVIGRESRGLTGAYEELLGRWWAVYDKHYRYPTPTPATSGRPRSDQRLVQQYVAGEQHMDYGFNPVSTPPSYSKQQGFSSGVGEGSVQLEQPMFDTADRVQSMARGESVPVPTIEQRRFSAPQAEWDPVNQPPPAVSKPEAANFPSYTYTMSDDRNFFQAPRSYPEPPKDMWYQVPKTPPASNKPKPLFPWEENQAPATRVFPEEPASPEPEPELVSSPPPELEPELALSVTTGGTTTRTQDSPTTPTIQVTSHAPFSSYARTNAWDDMPGIERYVQAVQASRRGKVQVVSPSDPDAPPEDVLSPSGESRRPSMRLTDFPTEFERPSLPVTPAPVRRPSFWGEERNKDGELPAADGVPQQQDWDPLKKLEELQRRQSEVLAAGPIGQPKELPSRNMPGSSAPLVPTSEETDVPQSSVSHDFSTIPNNTTTSGAFDFSDGQTHSPSFSAVSFVDDSKSGADEGVFSPTQS